MRVNEAGERLGCPSVAARYRRIADATETRATYHNPRAIPLDSAVRATLATVGQAFAAFFHDAAAAQGRQTGLEAASTSRLLWRLLLVLHLGL